MHTIGWVRRLAVGVGIVAAIVVFAAEDSRGQVYRYKNKDGVWVFTDRPEKVPPEARKTKPPDAPPPKAPTNLVRQFAKRFHPANSVERAVLATVVVESPLGSGTGFFLTDSGHILTNAHLLRKTNRQQTSDKEYFDALAARVGKAADSLEREKIRLANVRKQLDHMATMARNGTRAFKDYYSEKEAAYAQWLITHQERQTDLDTARRRLAEARRQNRYKTNAAAVRRNFTVRLVDGSQMTARLVALSDRYDLAMLKIDGLVSPSIPIRLHGRLIQSERVFAVGNPVSLDYSVSSGIFSGYRNGYLQTDAKVYPGNSGGPLLDAEGRVVGITTYKEITRKFEGLGFAIPIQKAINLFNRHLPGR